MEQLILLVEFHNSYQVWVIYHNFGRALIRLEGDITPIRIVIEIFSLVSQRQTPPDRSAGLRLDSLVVDLILEYIGQREFTGARSLVNHEVPFMQGLPSTLFPCFHPVAETLGSFSGSDAFSIMFPMLLPLSLLSK